MAIAALVLGIVGVVFGLVPLTGFIALICGTLALIFGVKGKHSENTGMAKAGRILGVIAIAMGVYGIYVVGTAVEQFERDMEEINVEMENYQQDFDRANAEAEAELERLEAELDSYPTYDSGHRFEE